MKIAELLSSARKGVRVKVRVPSSQKGELGELAKGVFQRLTRSQDSKRIVRVIVTVGGQEYEFRPQDVSLA
jgi:hypothetical protein